MSTYPQAIPAFLTKPALVCGLSVLALGASACKRNTQKADNAGRPDNAGTTVPGLHQNNLGKHHSSLVAHASHSHIHWQAWNPLIFKHAQQEHRTVFALIGSGTDPNTREVLRQLSGSPATSALLNRHHVNALIDSDCDPSMEFLASSLCLDTGTRVTRPTLIWFSYEGNPISWSSIGANPADCHEIVSNMSNTVYRLWRDDPEYVLRNSRTDFSRRSSGEHLKPYDDPDGNAPARAIRAISSLYDPTSNNIDRLGNISAARYINLLAKASTDGGLASDKQLRYGGTARLAAQNSLIHGLIDPLDGGVFDGIQRISTALPVFAKSLDTQALSMQALYNLYQLTEDGIYLTAADGIKQYTEHHLRLSSGDYRQGIIYAGNKVTDNPCVWTLEELEKALTEEELRICKLAFDIRGLGNVPMVDDRNRAYFRKNTLTWKTTKSELVEKGQVSRKKLDGILDSVMKKLAKIRTDRRPAATRENLTTTQSLSLYASALVSAYRATGDDTHLRDALRVLAHVRDNLTDGTGLLHAARYNGKLSASAASASAYCLAVAAALDLHEVTGEKGYLEMAQSLHAQMNKHLKGGGNHLLNEQDMSAYPVDYQVPQAYTIPNINNFASWALAWRNAARLLHYGGDKELAGQKEALEKVLLSLSTQPSVALVDFLTAYAGNGNARVYINGKAAGDLLATAARRPCNIIWMHGAKHHDLDKEVPEGHAAVIYGGKLAGTTDDASQLRTLLK